MPCSLTVNIETITFLCKILLTWLVYFEGGLFYFQLYKYLFLYMLYVVCHIFIFYFIFPFIFMCFISASNKSIKLRNYDCLFLSSYWLIFLNALKNVPIKRKRTGDVSSSLILLFHFCLQVLCMHAPTRAAKFYSLVSQCHAFFSRRVIPDLLT